MNLNASNREIILVSKDVNKNLILWGIKVVSFDTSAAVITRSGTINGKLIESVEDITEGKNIGKSNETTVLEQAISRARSRVNNKLKKGYKLPDETHKKGLSLFFNNGIKISESSIYGLKTTVEDIKTDDQGFVKPMKAVQYFKSRKEFTDSTGKYWKDKKYYFLTNLFNEEIQKEVTSSDIAPDFPAMIQPKINGVRAFLSYSNGKVKITSKEGLEYKNLHHIADEFEMNRDLLDFEDNIVFDGELYIQDYALQDVASAVKSHNMNTSLVKFHVFDLAIPNKANQDRFFLLKSLFERTMMSNTILVKTYKVYEHKQVVYFTKKFIEENYEGSIIRDFKSDYVFGSRRKNMSKLKATISEDFKITNVISQTKRPDLALFVCEYKGKTFKVTPTFDENTKKDILKNKDIFIGKKLQCSFYEWTNDLKPFHIIETTVRDYE